MVSVSIRSAVRLMHDLPIGSEIKMRVLMTVTSNSISNRSRSRSQMRMRVLDHDTTIEIESGLRGQMWRIFFL